jgi:tetratricopeptide (TPR) repeat protein
MAGRYQSALDSLAELEAGDLKSEATRQDAAYYRAYARAKLALAGEGDLTAAGVDLKNFITQHPQSWHFYEANELFGNLAVAAGKYEAATPYYEELAKAPWPDYQMRAAILAAKAQMHQGEFAEALANFEKVLADVSGTPQADRQKMLAQVGKIKCLAETGQPDEGIKLAEEIIASNSSEDVELFAGTYNALGACHLKAGRTKEALLAYLHTDILFKADAEAHAEALYHLGKLWTQVNKSERAVQARETLKEQYGGSPWASKM